MSILARVAASKTSSTPSIFNAEHSIGRVSKGDTANDRASADLCKLLRR